MSSVRTIRLLVVSAALAALAACGSAGDDNDPGTHAGAGTEVHNRPSMETMIKRYGAMRTEIFAALSKQFGVRGWKPSPDNDEFGESGCKGDPEGEIRFFPTMLFPGSYDAADWKDTSATVERVGRAHGFDDSAVVVDKPGNYELVGEDDFGGRYTFGMAKNTIFGLVTGCHRWDDKPSAFR